MNKGHYIAMRTLKWEELKRSEYINYFVKLEYALKYFFKIIIIFKIKIDKPNIKEIDNILSLVFDKYIKIDNFNFEMIWTNYFRKKTLFKKVLEEYFHDNKIVEKIQSIISMRNRVLHRYIFSFDEKDEERMGNLKRIVLKFPMPWENEGLNESGIKLNINNFKKNIKKINDILKKI